VDQFSANGATEGSCVSGLRAGDVRKAFKAHRVRAGQQFWRVRSSVVDTCANKTHSVMRFKICEFPFLIEKTLLCVCRSCLPSNDPVRTNKARLFEGSD
jgi:hypothetical protein